MTSRRSPEAPTYAVGLKDPCAIHIGKTAYNRHQMPVLSRTMLYVFWSLQVMATLGKGNKSFTFGLAATDNTAREHRT